MLRAALDTLYAGTGIIEYRGAMVMEPSVVELLNVRDLTILRPFCCLHVENLLLGPFSKERQKRRNNMMSGRDVCLESLGEVVPFGLSTARAM